MSGWPERPATDEVQLVSSVGIIGCGRMGSAIMARLLGSGFRVTAFDADERARGRARGMGAQSVGSAGDVASSCDLILLSLPNGYAVQAALADRGGLLSGGTPRTVVDLSTISINDAESASSACVARSWRYVSCPVIGGMSNCGNWTLLLDAEQVVPEIEAVLACLGRLELLGSPRAGLKIKLLANMMLAITAAGLMEALAVARAAGLSIESLHRVLTESGTVAVGPLFTKVLPSALSGAESNSFGVDLLLKDAGLAADLGSRNGQRTPVLDAASGEIRRRAEFHSPAVDFTALLRSTEEG